MNKKILSIVNRIGLSFITIVIVLILIVIILNINSLIGHQYFSTEQIQTSQLAVTLIGIFISVRNETKKIEKGILEEQRKEKREQKLLLLANIENWINDLYKIIEDIGVVKEFSKKDQSDGVLLVPNTKLLELRTELFRIDKRGYLFMGQLKDFGDVELQKRILLIWLLIDTYIDQLTNNRIPDIHPMVTSIADGKRQIDNIRKSI
jgi:hypothetical protein